MYFKLFNKARAFEKRYVPFRSKSLVYALFSLILPSIPFFLLVPYFEDFLTRLHPHSVPLLLIGIWIVMAILLTIKDETLNRK